MPAAPGTGGAGRLFPFPEAARGPASPQARAGSATRGGFGRPSLSHRRSSLKAGILPRAFAATLVAVSALASAAGRY
ncbi:MAG TPA: hypothetical protein PKC22_14165, partial [Rhodocyclaceae bacterium]|nr:hypothetical protein [Rhodocyclaceae bacterium]